MGGTRLIDRVRGAQSRFRNETGTSSVAFRADTKEFERIKKELQDELIESLDFEQVGQTPREELADRLRVTLTERVETRQLPLNRMERERLVEEILDNILGLGPLEPLLRDPEVSDIMINGPKVVYVERKGKLVKTNVTFNDQKHLMQIIDRIVAAVGRRIDETTPMVDARMADGSRFNAIIPPLALDGACVSIRRFGTVPIHAEDLVALGSVPRPILEVLRGAVRSALNIVISGGTGSGKTTLLNVLSSFIPSDERIITIEDSAELQLQQEHVVRLETRPPNLEGKGMVTPRDLVRNCLRMRPDRIILGEVRGAEAIDMLQAMNTGHDGSLATVHANSARDALARFETMVGIGMPNMSDKSIRETIARALDVIVQVDRLSDGSRRIISVTEVTGMEGPVITTQDIFVFEQKTIDENGKVRGVFRATGVRPRFAGRLASNGIRLSPELFRYEQEV
ncbi:MAG: CpaF family protein [Deltaproteobacteria bacterium]|nr:CpaF family protein [Deltaproteobacteria bacterium]MBW2253146.1 CpaF family protein [Deltaproteobacteria bacterium]